MNYNELKIHISNTGIKLTTDNLMINQNSNNNRLFLYAESDFRFVSVYFKRPDGITLPEIHMVPLEFNNDEQSYVFYVDIPYATTSFTMPNPTAQINVSFKCYTRNQDDQYIPITVSETQITVSRVDNSQVIDYGYTTDEINNIWNTLGVLQAEIGQLNIDELLNRAITQSTAINELSGNLQVANNRITETNQRVNAINEELTDINSDIDDIVEQVNNNSTDINTLYGSTGSLINNINDLTSNLSNNYYTKTETDVKLDAKQNTLISGTNIKTINNGSILGSGNLSLVTAEQIQNYYTKQQTDAAISNAISTLDIVEVVQTLPASGVQGKVYLVPKSTGDGNDVYSEYLWTGTDWEFIKTSVIDIDLSEYYKSSQVDNLFYKKTAVDTLLSNLHTTITGENTSSELALKQELEEDIQDVADMFDNYYDKTSVDTKDTNVYNNATSYTDTALADYYTQTQVNTILSTNYYTNTAIDGIISNYYTKTQIDNTIANYYTKTQIDTALNAYDTITSVNNKIAQAKREILVGDSNETLNQAYDTLLEVAQYIASDQSAAATMTSNIATNASEIQRVENKVDNRIVCTFKQW